MNRWHAFLMFMEVTSLLHTNLNVLNTSEIQGTVAFCNTRLHSGIYIIESREFTKIMFKRVDNHVTFVISKTTSPQLSSIIIKLGNCPLLQTEGIDTIFIEASKTEYFVSLPPFFFKTCSLL